MAVTAWMFPGQGAQSVGLLHALASAFPEIKNTFVEASDILHVDLWELAQNGPEFQLNMSAWTQPVLLTAGIAVFRLWRAKKGSDPAVLLGHSLGEYTALVAAEALTFSEAVRLVHIRGTYMQTAVPEGKGLMAAILGLSDEQVIAACEAVKEKGVVAPANFNTPGQVVIAGVKEAVEEAITIAKNLGAKRALPLAVSVPSHCALMEPAADQFKEVLSAVTWKTPRWPVLHNVDAQAQTTTEGMLACLSAQLYQPVQWVRCVEALPAFQVTHVLDSGPSTVLTGLVKRINPSLKCISLETPAAWATALGE